MWWKPAYILLILTSTIIDYFVGIYLYKTSKIKVKKILLSITLMGNIGLLVAFKYINFLTDLISNVLNYSGFSISSPQFNIILPVGISFYTFQTLSYSFEIYRGNQKPEYNFGKFALFVSFFPQLVAGPIERSYNLLPQFNKKVIFDYNNVTYGFRRILWGFFKKLVIADNIAPIVNTVYSNVENYNGPFYILATFLFAFQIYCDFSGYTDIAIGTAKTLGFDLMENFKRPYFSKSIGEFWKRWHISLSSWFKDYLYISLGGNRVVKWRWYYNLIITFAISGLWHGANLTFLFWGILNGIYLIISIITRDFRNFINKIIKINNVPTLKKILQVFCTFTLICLSWIFFRANNLDDAIYIVSNIGNGTLEFLRYSTVLLIFKLDLMPLKQMLKYLNVESFNFFIIIISLIFLILVQLKQRKTDIFSSISTIPNWSRWFIYIAITVSILIFGNFSSQEFIYFRF